MDTNFAEFVKQFIIAVGRCKIDDYLYDEEHDGLIYTFCGTTHQFVPESTDCEQALKPLKKLYKKNVVRDKRWFEIFNFFTSRTPDEGDSVLVSHSSVGHFVTVTGTPMYFFACIEDDSVFVFSDAPDTNLFTAFTALGNKVCGVNHELGKDVYNVLRHNLQRGSISLVGFSNGMGAAVFELVQNGLNSIKVTYDNDNSILYPDGRAAGRLWLYFLWIYVSTPKAIHESFSGNISELLEKYLSQQNVVSVEEACLEFERLLVQYGVNTTEFLDILYSALE